jgi:[ribosomal protein S5]-alanine N-acetyltransferase
VRVIVRLVPIQRGGLVTEDIGALSGPTVKGVLEATAGLYEAAGFAPPWICYFAMTNGRLVGTCGFKSAPHQGRVEIAYFTFPNYEGKGVATQMARLLLSIAREADATVTVTAQTLPGRNPSHRVLEKLGFSPTGSLEHPEDGTVLEWQMPE